jgi:phage terminase large subunit-like protein
MNYIYQYYQQIQEGTVTVGKWIRLWYGLIVQGIEDTTFIFIQKKAAYDIVFIENFCRHHEGQLAPGKLKLELWQKAFLSVVFGILDEDGHRQFREVVLIVARKNGKTLFAAAIAAYCAFIDGEYGARVYFAAPKLEQAGLCFDAFCQMIYKEPVLDKISQKRRTDIYIKESNCN